MRVLAFVAAGLIQASSVAGAVWIPDDQEWPLQTDFQRIGADRAWDSAADPSADLPDSLGSDSVLVAVIDIGFAHHPDLARAWFKNEKDPIETVGAQIDDDGNGYISDFMGWDFVDMDNDPFTVAGDCALDVTHGTAAVGLVAAQINNANAGGGLPPGPGLPQSIAGMAQVKVVPIRIAADADCVPSGAGWGYYDNMLSGAINYARLIDADVISMSVAIAPERWGGYVSGPGYVPNTLQALDQAYNDGILIVAASGDWNSSSDPYCWWNEGPFGYNCNLIHFPATDPHVIAVTGTDDAGAAESDSSAGPEAELAAPYVTVRSLDWFWFNNAQEWKTSDFGGTSAGAPIVAGVGALVKSYRSDLTAPQIREILKASANGDGTHSDALGWGEVDPAAALDLALQTREIAYGGGALPGAAVAAIGPSTQPASDIDGMGNTHLAFVGDVNNNGYLEVFYQVIDSAGHSVFGPARVEAGSGMQGNPSDSVDIAVDGWGNANIAWVERTSTATDGEIYHVEYAPDHTVATAIAHVNTQISPYYLGRVENLNVLFAPSGLYYMYDQDLTETLNDRYIMFNNPSMSPNAVPIQPGRDPSADIAPDAFNDCVTECVYFAYVAGNFQASQVYWAVIDLLGQLVFGVVEVQGSFATYIFSAPSLDLDPATMRSALAWSRFDVVGDDIPYLQTHSISFAWIDHNGDFGSQFPKSLGTLGGGGLDPSVSANSHGGAGIVWTGKWADDSGPDVVYVEVSKTGLETTFSLVMNEAQIIVGAGPGTPNAGDPLYPQAAASKPLFDDWDYETYDRSDGNYRFVWLQNAGGTVKPHYASTRPAFSAPMQIVGGAWVLLDPDYQVGSDGSHHVAYVRQNVNGVPEVRYAYWPPGQSPANGPPLGPGAFDVFVCCNGGPAESPTVELTAVSMQVPPYQVVTKMFVHVFFVRNDPPFPVIWVAKYNMGQQNPLGGYPKQFGADRPAAAQLIPDAVLDLDTTVYNDHESAAAGLGSNTNPANNFPLEPVISAVWVETFQSQNPPFDGVLYGATDADNNVIQVQSEAAWGTSMRYPSVTHGPGDRVYIAYADAGDAFITSFRIPAQFFNPCGWLQLNPPGVFTHRVNIRADREFEKPGETPSSSVEYSDDQIHVVMGVTAPPPPVGPGGPYYDLLYTRVRHIANRACNAPNPPYFQTTVEVHSILPKDFNGDGYDSESLPAGISMEIGRDNHPLIAYSAAKDITVSHDCGSCKAQIYLIGLTGAGVPEYFSESRLTTDTLYDAYTPALALNDFQEAFVVYQSFHQLPNGVSIKIDAMQALDVEY